LPRKTRTYRLGQREATVAQTRARIVVAARDLLASSEGFAGFTVDAVAARAGVARMTVFNQFGSKIGLLEALFDDLAARGLVERLRTAFMRPEPREALADFIAAFGGFWQSDRLVIRRIRGMVALDVDFEKAVNARDERRRQGLRTLMGRLAEQYGKPAPAAHEEVVTILHTLTSFETFDSLAGATRDPEQVIPVVQRLAGAVVGFDDESARKSSRRR
jgi:AcrR family transcriptional regulator